MTPALAGLDSPQYWVGYLGEVVRGTAEKLNREILDPSVRTELERARDEYMSSPVYRQREIVGLAVVARNGECYALRRTYAEAAEAQSVAINYLHGALASGHPRSTEWVRERLPFRVLCVDAGEWAEFADEGEPVLDREP